MENYRPSAYALILLRSQGYPCVFYPDIYGAVYADTGGNGQPYDIKLSPVDQLEAMLRIRKCCSYGRNAITLMIRTA
jgi:alpha-amylase